MENKESSKFSISKRLKSFRYAFNGLRILFREEHNARIHLVVTVIVIIAGFIVQLSVGEWLIVCLLIGMVFGMEIINSALENLCDHVSPEWNGKIKKVKDLAAAGVFVVALISVIAGIILFFPKIVQMLNTT